MGGGTPPCTPPYRYELRVNTGWSKNATKNWVPFVMYGVLHIAYSIDPIVCVLRCTENQAGFDCNIAPGWCPYSYDISPAVGEYRGMTSGIDHNGTLVGLGHKKINGDFSTPFLFSITKNATKAQIVDLDIAEAPIENGINDPTSLVITPDGDCYVTMTHSEFGWFRPQKYSIRWYKLTGWNPPSSPPALGRLNMWKTIHNATLMAA